MKAVALVFAAFSLLVIGAIAGVVGTNLVHPTLNMLLRNHLELQEIRKGSVHQVLLRSTASKLMVSLVLDPETSVPYFGMTVDRDATAVRGMDKDQDGIIDAVELSVVERDLATHNKTGLTVNFKDPLLGGAFLQQTQVEAGGKTTFLVRLGERWLVAHKAGDGHFLTTVDGKEVHVDISSGNHVVDHERTPH